MGINLSPDLSEWFKEPSKTFSRKDEAVLGGFILVLLALPGAIVYAVVKFAYRHRETLAPFLRSHLGATLGFTILFGVALWLFSWRKTHIKEYALVELSVGAAAALLAVAPVDQGLQTVSDPDRILKALAAIYLVIRALDNWQKKSSSQTAKELERSIDKRISHALDAHAVFFDDAINMECSFADIKKGSVFVLNQDLDAWSEPDGGLGYISLKKFEKETRIEFVAIESGRAKFHSKAHDSFVYLGSSPVCSMSAE